MTITHCDSCDDRMDVNGARILVPGKRRWDICDGCLQGILTSGNTWAHPQGTDIEAQRRELERLTNRRRT